MHSTKSFSIDGIYDIEASTHHILKYFSKKINNGEMLNSFEEEALDLILAIMKSNQGSHSGGAYQGLFSRNGWEFVPNGRTPSGVAPFYKIFLLKIARTLFDNGIIYTDPDKNLIGAIREFTLAINQPIDSLWRKISDIKSGSIYGGSDKVLNELYISLEDLVLSNWIKTPSESYKCIKNIEDHFDFLQFIQGDLFKNKFYTELDLISYKIVEIISGATIPNYKGTVTSLNKDVLDSASFDNIISAIKYTNGPPSLPPIIHLRESIIKNIKPYITAAQLDKILFLVDNYKASIVAYHNGIDLLSDYKDSYKKALINDLINSKFTTILQECYSIRSLSRFLFGETYPKKLTYFLSPSTNLIPLHNLRHIKVRVSLWVLDDFKGKGYIDQTTLDLFKGEIIDKIDGFISYEKLSEYDALYDINPDEESNYNFYWYVQPGYGSELEVIQALYDAVVAFTGNPTISLMGLGKAIGMSPLIQASSGRQFSLSTFRKMISKLEQYIKKDTVWRIPPSTPNGFIGRLKLAQRQEIYENAKDAIRKCMREYGIARPWNWHEGSVKGYHVIKLLKRNLGFDLLSFTTLDKDSFLKTSKNKFQRHHFRNSFFRKLSNYVQDLILTDIKHHRKYEKFSEAQTLVIMNGFDKMMDMEGSGRDKNGNPMITRQDVIDIFKGNEWVLYGPENQDGTRTGGKDGKQGWFFSDKKFDEMLTQFNERKTLLINEGLEQFLIDEYDTVYERFLSRSIEDASGFYSIVVPRLSLEELAMSMNMDAWFNYPVF